MPAAPALIPAAAPQLLPSAQRRSAHLTSTVARAVGATEPASPQADGASTSGQKPEVVKLDQAMVSEKMGKSMKRLTAAKRKVGLEGLLVEIMKTVPVTLVGDDWPLLQATARRLADRLGWFPVDTQKVLCGIAKVDSLDKIAEDQRFALEADMLKGLRRQARVVIPTLPGGATTRTETWQDMWGSIIIWVDEEDKLRPKPSSPARELYEARAEVAARVKVQRGFGVKDAGSSETRARHATDVIVVRMSKLLGDQPDLVHRKTQYMTHNLRSEVLQPSTWTPVTDKLKQEREAKLAATIGGSSETTTTADSENTTVEASADTTA